MKNNLSNTKNKAILIVGSLLVVSGLGFGVWYYLKRRKNKKEFVANKSKGTPRKPAEFKCTSRSYPLNYGTCHKDVKTLQRYLKTMGTNLGNYGKYKNGIDGRFGKLTRQAAQDKLQKESFSKIDIQLIEIKLKPKYSTR